MPTADGTQCELIRALSRFFDGYLTVMRLSLEILRDSLESSQGCQDRLTLLSEAESLVARIEVLKDECLSLAKAQGLQEEALRKEFHEFRTEVQNVTSRWRKLNEILDRSFGVLLRLFGKLLGL